MYNKNIQCQIDNQQKASAWQNMHQKFIKIIHSWAYVEVLSKLTNELPCNVENLILTIMYKQEAHYHKFNSCRAILYYQITKNQNDCPKKESN